MNTFQGYGIRVSSNILRSDLIWDLIGRFYIVNSNYDTYLIEISSCSNKIPDMQDGWLLQVEHPSCSTHKVDEKSQKYIDVLQNYLSMYTPSTHLIVYGYFIEY